MRIEKESGKFVAYIPFSMKETLRSSGWIWDAVMKKWITFKPSIAAEYFEFSVGQARRELEDYRTGLTGAVAESMASDTDFQPNAPEGLEYLPFQKAGIEYGTKRRDVLIADPPGLGKTVQAIGLANWYPAKQERIRVLIICPAYLKINWKREYEKWDTRGLTIGIAQKVQEDKLDDNGQPCRKPSPDGKRLGAKIKHMVAIWPDTDVVIVHDNVMPDFYQKIQDISWDIFIADECHAYTNQTSKRSSYVWGAGRGKKRIHPVTARKRIFLTGTPITKKPYNMWAFCRAFDPNGLGKSWESFVYRYCDAYKDHFGLHYDGESNLEELNFKLREAFMVRREKTEVLKELPPKRRELVVLQNEGILKQVEAEINKIGEFLNEFEKIVGAIDQEDGNSLLDGLQKLFPEDIEGKGYEEIAGLMSQEQTAAFEEMSKLRKALAIAKVPDVKSHVDKLLETENKVILFCHHTDVAAELKKHYEDAAFVTGKVTPMKRQDQVDRFQTDPECRVLIGNIAAAGVGFTMTAASTVVFAELVWLPSELEQAEDRAWRIGQNEFVLVQHLVVQGSLDSRFVEVLIERMDMIDRALSPKSALQHS